MCTPTLVQACLLAGKFCVVIKISIEQWSFMDHTGVEGREAPVVRQRNQASPALNILVHALGILFLGRIIKLFYLSLWLYMGLLTLTRCRSRMKMGNYMLHS